MKDINWDAPLSEDDLAWLQQRMTPVLAEKVAANQAKFAKEETDADDDDTEVEDDYDSWKVAELKEEAEKRDPVIDLTGITKKPDLIAALRTWDAENAEEAEA